MGIEALGGITGAQAYTASSTSASKPVSSERKVDSEAVDVGMQSATTSQPVVIKKVEESSQGGKADQNQGDERQREKGNDTLMNAAKDMNKLINQNTVAEFGYHEDTRRITIKIKDKDTDEVIREIPSEKALEMLAKAWELAGIMVDEKR